VTALFVCVCVCACVFVWLVRLSLCVFGCHYVCLLGIVVGWLLGRLVVDAVAAAWLMALIAAAVL
jgi:hypothetical protein